MERLSAVLLHASLDEKTLNIAPMFKHAFIYSATTKAAVQGYPHKAASLYFTVMSLSVVLFYIYL